MAVRAASFPSGATNPGRGGSHGDHDDRRTAGGDPPAHRRARGASPQRRSRDASTAPTEVEALRQEEELARAAVREKAEAVEDKFWQLEADLGIATNRLDAELASEAKLFADAVDAELRDWEALIERLQTQAAEKTGNAREQAETVIAELRQWRNRVAERLAEIRASAGERGPSRRRAPWRRSTSSSRRFETRRRRAGEEEDMTSQSTASETFDSKVNEQLDEAVSEGERMLARVWKIIAANGVAAILFGFVLLLWPSIGLTTIVAVVAVCALVRGVLSGMAAFSAPLPQSERRWLVLEAVVGTAIGIALLVWNDISAQALLYVVAAWALAIGVLMLAAAFELPLSGGRRMLLVLNGLVAGAFGAVMLIEPDAGAVAIVALIAAFFMVIGVMHVGFALELRSIAADVRERFPRPSTTKPVAH